MLQIKDIKALNIEVSARCIGHCPFCSRQQKIRTFKEHVITLSEFKLLPDFFLKQLKRMIFSGNFGDLCSNSEFVEIAKHAKLTNDGIALGGDTHGALQNEDWWKSLGGVFHDGCMVFCVDGLADTHSLYRRGTHFHKTVRNIKAFTSSGGVAHWKFIAFEHNEHQIKEAEVLARDIGCSRFYVISSRDYNDTLRRPKRFNFQIKRDVFLSYQAKLDDKDRQALCKPLNNRSIYIAADGTVHPCCFAHCMYITEHNKKFQYIVPLIEKYHAEINFKTRPIQEIVSGPYFKEVFLKSKTNPFCIIKCNKYKKEIRKELVLYDNVFDLK